MLPVLDLAELTPDHIQRLIDSEVSEHQTLEYKRELPTKQSDSKRDFLYEVAAMANSAGGDIVCGIVDRQREGAGVADSLSGIRLPCPQIEIDRLGNLIRDCIAPRLAGVVMRAVSCPDGDALAIRIPRSWEKPHMVTIDTVNRFYRRAGSTKYPMSVDEIRRAYLEQSEIQNAVAEWRTNRADMVTRGKGPIGLIGPVTMLFHVIPASAFGTRALTESWKVPQAEKDTLYVPYGARTPFYNADGLLCTAYFDTTKGATHGYIQLFRSGIAEYADGNCCRGVGMGGPFIIGQDLEKQMVQCFKDAIRRLRQQGQSGLAFVGFSLIGIERRLFFISPLFGTIPEGRWITQSNFNSPEVAVDINEPEEWPFRTTLGPLADTMWQVAGCEGTPYKEKGVWEPFKDYR